MFGAAEVLSFSSFISKKGFQFIQPIYEQKCTQHGRVLRRADDAGVTAKVAFKLPSCPYAKHEYNFRCKAETTNSKNALEPDMVNGDELPVGLKRELMPRHVAVITDGNRRWAKQKGLVPIEGYKAGFESIKLMMTRCEKWGIPVVSFYVFSSENWGRPMKEVSFLVYLFETKLKEELNFLMRAGVRVSVIGDTKLFPTSLQEAIRHAEETTKNNTKLHLILAMSYSGQNDIIHACQNLAMKAKDGIIKPEDITKSVFEQELQTKVTDIPRPDLLIRSSGELRISNYYLWQLAYSEMYFTDAHWPDFDEREFVIALVAFQKRQRRFGVD